MQYGKDDVSIVIRDEKSIPGYRYEVCGYVNGAKMFSELANDPITAGWFAVKMEAFFKYYDKEK